MTELLRVNSENAIREQWKLLARYAYPTNILMYMEKHGLAKSNELAEYIAGCFRQSEAYFTATDNAPMDISPLLQYYGAATLLAGASALIKGKKLPIEGHGMTLNASDIERIADAQVIPRKNGALQQFAAIYSTGCSFIDGSPWTMEEILGSVPDLKQDFENCYQEAVPSTIPIEMVKRNRGSLERIAKSDLARYKKPDEALSLVANFSDSYLTPDNTNEYIILHRKINTPEIGTYSLFNQKYLQMAHSKNGKLLTPSQIIVMFMGMYALGFLTRYHPEFWNSFVRSDKTGELLLIEKFIDVCHRYFPNLVLNEIYESRVQFVYETKDILDLSTPSAGIDTRGQSAFRGIPKRDIL